MIKLVQTFNNLPLTQLFNKTSLVSSYKSITGKNPLFWCRGAVGDMSSQIWNKSTKMNLPHGFYINIQSCSYFKNLMRLKTYHEVVHEITKEVKNLEPWVKGTNVPSTTWCLLFKLFTLKLTEKQLTDMLDNETNPFVRGMSMLYVRLTIPPTEMWDWFEPYLVDDHEIRISHTGKTLMMAYLVKELIEDQKFCEILLPRIPVPIHRVMKANLERELHKLPKLPTPAQVVPNTSRRSNTKYQTREDRVDKRDRRQDRGRDDDRGRDRYERSRSPKDSYRDRNRGGYKPYDREIDYRDDRRRNSSPRYHRSARSPTRRRSPSPRRYYDSRSPPRSRRSPKRSPSPKRHYPAPSTPPTIPTQPKSNEKLEKLKEMYSSQSGTNKKSGNSMYGDNLGDEVVRIGFY